MVDEPVVPALEDDAIDEITVRRGPSRMSRASIILGIAPLVGLVVFLGAWQLVVEIFSIEAYKLPAPWRILRHIASDPGFYARHSRTTLWEAFVGFMLAMLLAIPLATAMALSRFIDRAVMPIAVLIQVTPIIAYAPAVVLWVGTGFRSIIVITTVVCFVPFLVNLVSGLRSVDPLLLELAHSVDAGRSEVFWRLRVPSALPNLFAAARISVGLALIGAVLGEFFGLVKGGLGFALKTAQSRGFRGIDQVWGCVFVLAFIGAVATFLLSVAERAALHWHASQRR
ncbi:ABC transporter permease [Desertimonas flava]|jgi:NitT/TauT family transport system permease protein|uniref:ABC transporter permease n=1 Tax=Desertimonas flava TaxID=2064846 RepID=UPI000E3528D8|nr:ABC transporter permease [Desertimonas flava]